MAEKAKKTKKEEKEVKPAKAVADKGEKAPEVLKVEKKEIKPEAVIAPAEVVIEKEVSEGGENSEEAEKKSYQKKKKKIKKQVQKGQAHIQCTYNNTMISITDLNGGILGWSSSGLLGFKGAKKSTPYAATQVAADVTEKVKKYGVQDLEVFVKGVGSGREASIRALAARGFDLILIKDITPIPHNGCRPRKPRRV
jgi:small subunit ribosomal protein S11